MLDQVVKKRGNRYITFAFKALISTIVLLLIFILLYLFYKDGPNVKIIGRLITLGIIVSNLCGVIFTVVSHIEREEKSNFKTLVKVVNLILFVFITTVIILTILSIKGYPAIEF